MKCLELTLAIVKPNATKLPHVVQGIRNRILNSGFYVVRTTEVHLSLREAQDFYIVHKDKFFYDRLTSFLSSGFVHVHVLAGINSILLWRRILGPAKVYKAKVENPLSIRALYGVTDTRNSAHGSDSAESAANEIRFFFPTFNIEKWHLDEEKSFKSCHVKFNEKEFVHQISTSVRY